MNEDNVLHEENEVDSVQDISSVPANKADTQTNSSEDSSISNTQAAMTVPDAANETSTASETNSEQTTSAVSELIEAIKQELANSEKASELANASNAEIEIESDTAAETETIVSATSSSDSDYDEDELEADEVYLIDDIHPASYQSDVDEAIYIASGSNASYETTVVNRLDNILTCSIITACCALLLLLHTLKKE